MSVIYRFRREVEVHRVKHKQQQIRYDEYSRKKLQPVFVCTYHV